MIWRNRRLKWKARLRRGGPGTLETIPAVESPELGNSRNLYIYLPPSYPRGRRRYPVLYMHDGQNLFDPALSFAGAWHVREAMDWASGKGAGGGLEAIVVGIPNMGTERLNEYSPFADAKVGGGRGDLYLDFVTRTVKPLIDSRYRTLAERAHTGIVGSSLGGLISIYGFFRNHETFGFAGVLSPSVWFARRAILPYVASAPYVPGHIYLDVGTDEGSATVENTRTLRDLLIGKGYQPGVDLKYVEDVGGRHEEAAWGRRFREALPFLLKPEVTT